MKSSWLVKTHSCNPLYHKALTEKPELATVDGCGVTARTAGCLLTPKSGKLVKNCIVVVYSFRVDQSIEDFTNYIQGLPRI